MKLFLTGGTGLLGKSVVKRLLKESHDLYILTRQEPTDSLYQNSRITLIKGSLENISTWESHLIGVDAIIHMAAPVVFWGIKRVW